MQQTEQEYLRILKERLAGYVSSEDLDEILEEYAEHFSIGRSKGRNEEELYKALGSPEEVAKEIRATYLVKKAEQTRSPHNIWRAATATSGLDPFNFFVVLIPFIILILLLAITIVAGAGMVIAGPVLLLLVILQALGVTIPLHGWSSPLSGVALSFGISILGIIVIMVAVYLIHFFSHHVVRYLKWNVRGTRYGTEAMGWRTPASGTTAVSRDGATALDLKVRFGAGELVIGEGTDDKTLVNVTPDEGNGAIISGSLLPYAATKRVMIRNSHDSWWCGEGWAHAWDIRLNREVPVALDLRNGAGRTRLDLGALNLSSLSIRNGVGETRIDLSGYHGGNFDASLRTGVGSLLMRVPKDSNVTIQIKRGLGGTTVHGLMVNGDTYTTRTDRSGAPAITCWIRQGMGSVSLEAV
jgi:uncharacterized membrane protein